MNNKQLNNLVISYQEDFCERKFSEIFDKVTKIWRQSNILHSLSRKYGLEFSDVESLAYYWLYDAVRNYEDSGNFYNFLSTIISRKCMSLRRDLANQIENEISLDASINPEDEGDEHSDNPLLDFLIHANVEDEAIENLQRKDDQRQLIVHLLDKAPDKSRQALKAYVDSDFSFPTAAKQLGISYPAVKRRVEKIATYFDANQKGNIYDYFTVATSA